MKEPLVSVVIPVYNAEKYIAEAIKSVLAQTYANWEIVIADYGSSDRTAEIVKSFNEAKIRYFYQKNQGQSAARNLALANCRGDYVAFLDADDIFLPQKLERQVAFMENRPECDFSYCKIRYFYDGKPQELFDLNIEHPSGLLKEDLIKRGGHTMAPIGVMFRCQWFDRYGGFDNSLRRSDEYFFYLKMALGGARFCYLDEVLSLNRLNRWSLTRNETYLKETAEANLKIFDWLDKTLDKNDPARKYLPIIRRHWQLRLAIGHFILRDKKRGIMELKKLRGVPAWIFILFCYILPAGAMSFFIKSLRGYREKFLFKRVK
jgi:glycosyltransferase involved in cell wall biosynthesis